MIYSEASIESCKNTKGEIVMGTSLPFFRLLTPEDLKQIDQTGRQILKSVGLRILDSTFLDRLKEAGVR